MCINTISLKPRKTDFRRDNTVKFAKEMYYYEEAKNI